MRLVFTPHGWEDYTYWLAADRATLGRINRLMDNALRDPVAGIGKPEPLRRMFAGAWSRRISEENRLVYLVDGDDLVILEARSTTSDRLRSVVDGVIPLIAES
ncbi:MAG TPA: Txe/YoeB family addiction module toxin [Propionibacteriaceae bacterium]|nr:Txe/YoeB family addiction module toxin [Propionibacteriaceae bacterium]